MNSLDLRHGDDARHADEFPASSQPSAHVTFSALMPSGARLAEIWGDEPLPRDSTPLLPRTANWKRTRDFLRGRHCAQVALEQMSIFAQSIPIGGMGAPVWPEGVVGSITHTNSYAAAVVAPASRIGSIGIDAEEVDAVHEELWRTLFTPRETRWLHQFHATERLGSAALLFSAKEAIYKAQFPITRAWLEFQHVEVTAQPQGKFVAAPAEGCPMAAWNVLGNLAGRYLIAREHVMTAVWFPPHG